MTLYKLTCPETGEGCSKCTDPALARAQRVASGVNDPTLSVEVRVHHGGVLAEQAVRDAIALVEHQMPEGYFTCADRKASLAIAAADLVLWPAAQVDGNATAHSTPY